MAATKKDMEMRRGLARYYFMQGEVQKAIAAKVGVSEPTLSKWVKAENWDQRRAGMNITRPELVNKMLLAINNLLNRQRQRLPMAPTQRLCKRCKEQRTYERRSGGHHRRRQTP